MALLQLCTLAHDIWLRMLVPMSQRVLNKLNKERNISGHKWSARHRVLRSHRRNMGVTNMLSWKTICHPGYYHNGFMAWHVQVHELPQSHCGDNREDTVFFKITCVLRSSCFYETWALCVSWISYDHFITLLNQLGEHFLVHCYQSYVTLHHLPKCMGCQKAIVVIIGRAHCFSWLHVYIYIFVCMFLFLIE